MMKRWLTFALLVFALNFAWEMAQGKWFASMQGLPFWRATLQCARATFGDLVITAIAFAVAAVVGKSTTWPTESRIVSAGIVFVTVGIASAAGYEVFAVSTGRWHYAETMPMFFGVGALPLLQWLLLPPIEVVLFRLIAPRFVRARDVQHQG